MVGSKKKSLTKNTVIIVAGSLLGNIFGLLREILYANYFGTLASFDAFVVIINFTFTIIYSLTYAIPLILIPLIVKDELDKNKSTDFVSGFYVIIGICILLILGCEACGYWILKLISPGFHGPQFDEALFLYRLGVPLLLLMTMAVIFKSILNSYSYFFLPAVETCWTNAIIILVLVVASLSGKVTPAFALQGYLWGYALFVLMCLKKTWRLVNYSEPFNLKYAGSFAKKFLISAAGWLIFTLNSTVILANASLLGEGAVSSLAYTQRILFFSVGVLINSVLIASYPELSKDFIQKGADFIRKRTEILMGYCLITVSFIVIFLILNGETVIRLLFQRGKFTGEATSLVSTLLLYYIPWMIFFPMSSILTRLIFIYEDGKIFCLISFACLLAAVVLAYGLRKALGLNGLGLASGIIQYLYAAMIYSWLYLKRNFKISLPHIARVVGPGVLIAAILWIILSVAGSTAALQRHGPQQLIFPGISFILLSLCCWLYLQRVERSSRLE